MTIRIGTLRFGRRYESADTVPLCDVRTGEAVAIIDVVNAGLIRRDAARRVPEAARVLRATPIETRLDCVERAADLFLEGDFVLGDRRLTLDQHLRLQSQTTGIPVNLCRTNADKVASACRSIRTIVAGLTRSLDPEVLDTGVGYQGNVLVGFAPAARSLSGVMPSNSPGVHTLWIPALALGVPVALKPGASEPWTPLRLIAALIEAGLPGEAFGYYPTDHAGADALTQSHDRSLVFGGAETVARFAGRPSVSVHGPGYAAVVLGPDEATRFEDHVGVMVDSVLRNGGRSCINASTIVVPPGWGDKVANAVAAGLSGIEPTALDDQSAQLAGFPTALVADAIDAQIDLRLQAGARAITTGARRVDLHGLAFLRPTVVRCGPDHGLAKAEYGFPFVAVVEVEPSETAQFLGQRLVVTAITRDPDLRRSLVGAVGIDRLHLGPVATCEIQWDQPHEGNLFEWLYRRRAMAVKWAP